MCGESARCTASDTATRVEETKVFQTTTVKKNTKKQKTLAFCYSKNTRFIGLLLLTAAGVHTHPRMISESSNKTLFNSCSFKCNNQNVESESLTTMMGGGRGDLEKPSFLIIYVENLLYLQSVRQ